MAIHLCVSTAFDLGYSPRALRLVIWLMR